MSRGYESNSVDRNILDDAAQWDMRSYHLLHTVPGLDKCQLRFNHSGDVIYGGESPTAV